MELEMQKSIKLMNDYDCFPLWWNEDESGNIGEIDSDTLPISEKTLKKILDWQKKYDNQLDIEDPTNSNWLSGKELDLFEEQGKQLWKILIDELGNNYKVAFFSQKENRLIVK